MIVREISIKYLCTKCSNSVYSSYLTSRMAVEDIWKKIDEKKCCQCDSPYSISRVECRIDPNVNVKYMDLRLKCAVCGSSWTQTCAWILGTPLIQFAKDIRNNTLCISKFCDSRNVIIVKANVEDQTDNGWMSSTLCQ
jgi:hypothetical protein